jgi:hypothetical protein
MINLKTLTRLAKGAISQDEIEEIFAAMGVDFAFEPVPELDKPAAFQAAALASIEPGAQLVAVRGRMKNGDEVAALLILRPAATLVTHPAKKQLDAGNGIAIPSLQSA